MEREKDYSKSYYLKKDWKDMTQEECIAEYYGQKKLIESVSELIQKSLWDKTIHHDWEDITVDSSKDGKVETSKLLETWSIEINSEFYAITKEFAEYLIKNLNFEIHDVKRPKKYKVKTVLHEEKEQVVTAYSEKEAEEKAKGYNDKNKVIEIEVVED